MEDYYFVSYTRKNGNSVDEFYDNFEEANNRKNSLINEFGYSSIEVKVTCQFMKVQWIKLTIELIIGGLNNGK